jgi:hypothetical protein
VVSGGEDALVVFHPLDDIIGVLILHHCAQRERVGPLWIIRAHARWPLPRGCVPHCGVRQPITVPRHAKHLGGAGAAAEALWAAGLAA